MISKAKTVDAFLTEQSLGEREFFTALRKIILKAAPAATESMQYGMPSYFFGTESFCAFNRQKNYLCLYIEPAAVKLFAAELNHLDVGKSCIRLKKPADLPLALAEKIIRKAVRLRSSSRQG